MPYAHGFLTILQSATLEIGPLRARISALIRARTCQIVALEDRIRSLTMMMYRSTILILITRVESHGFIILFLTFLV